MLIVDDNADNVALLRRVVSKHLCPAESASSGQEALDIMAMAKPQLVLLDWMMPEMGGLEVLKAIRNDEKYNNLAVVIYTALKDSKMRTLALAAGAQDVIVKGDFEGIAAAVHKYAAI